MGLEDDFLLADADDEKTIEYIKNYLPQELMDYVVVHELAHRLEMNHSARFWNIVGKYDPKYREHQKMLTEIGINS